jgi:hypothetical protein
MIILRRPPITLQSSRLRIIGLQCPSRCVAVFSLFKASAARRPQGKQFAEAEQLESGRRPSEVIDFL